MDNKLLRDLQLTELEILKVVHEFCEKNDIKYSLYAGTALGAVRHKGFIPWDDDVDIVMTRDEFEKFCLKWKQNPVEGYYFQNPNDYNKKIFNINHGKIRKDNTILLSEGEDLNDGHHGVWVDIFILDKVKDSFFGKKSVYFWGVMRTIFSRNEISYDVNFVVKTVFKILNSVPNALKKKIVSRANKKVQKYKNLSSGYEWVDLSTITCFKIYFPKILVEKFTKIRFEDSDLIIFDDYDKLLTLEYGDYMQLPPVEERVCKHNPVKIQL
ncbi:phosphorylcholine transferase LicD [Intestinibacter bartlettii]|uniref:phosphorylcholine transferase LicD n=1 Tax=Intestinibacter bartlettii TaxID=261299 RepID=UPI0034A2C727